MNNDTPKTPVEVTPTKPLPATLPHRSLRIPHVAHPGLWLHITLLAVVLAFAAIPQTQSLLQQHTQLGESEARQKAVEDAASANVTTQNTTPDVLNGTILETALLPEDHVVEFVEILESAATKTGVTQQIDLLSGQRVVQRGVVVIPSRLTISGSWDTVVKFLAELEASPLYLNVTAMDIIPDNAQSSDVLWTISATTYWQQAI
jgi:Tfp pilus assembly protein PilO